MKITRVDAETRRIPFEGVLKPAWSPGNTWQDIATTIFRVETSDGLVGIGAGHGSPEVVRERVA
ncbi:MAG TPA: hypothetical protein VFL82_01895, partial [Thermomicrobiales bacterium]|nr:hypothetical protein [Thermomicrobiales bacterium]